MVYVTKPSNDIYFSEAALTYQKELKITKGMEAVDSNNMSLKAGEPVIHKVRDRIPQETRKKTCYHCGRTGHFPNDCRFKEPYCHGCGKKGNIPPVCRSQLTMEVDTGLAFSIILKNTKKAVFPG